MGYLKRMWTVATVAAESATSDQTHTLKTGLRSLHSGKHFGSSAGATETSDHRLLSALAVSEPGCGGEAEEKRKRAEESFRQVMYLSCWGQI